MGVQSLWQLLAPAGSRVNIETLSNKRVAVDASIWLIQFVKAMRNDNGETVKNAHLLGFFRRICRMLFHRIRPVFVFDGATPALKRHTLAARRRRREQQSSKLRRTAEKLLLNQLKKHRLLQQQQELQQEEPDEGGDAAAASGAAAKKKKKSAPLPAASTLTKEQQLEADALLAASLADEDEAGGASGSGAGGAAGEGAGAAAGGEADGEGDAEEEDDDDDGFVLAIPDISGVGSLDTLDPAALAALPASVQLELLAKLREQRFAENQQSFQRASNKAPQDFSELQLTTFLKTSNFRRSLDRIIKEGDTGRRGDQLASKHLSGNMVRGANPHWEREFVFTTSFPDDSGGFKAGPFGEDRRARKVPWLASSAAAEEGRSAVTSTLHHVLPPKLTANTRQLVSDTGSPRGGGGGGDDGGPVAVAVKLPRGAQSDGQGSDERSDDSASDLSALDRLFVEEAAAIDSRAIAAEGNGEEDEWEDVAVGPSAPQSAAGGGAAAEAAAAAAGGWDSSPGSSRRDAAAGGGSGGGDDRPSGSGRRRSGDGGSPEEEGGDGAGAQGGDDRMQRWQARQALYRRSHGFVLGRTLDSGWGDEYTEALVQVEAAAPEGAGDGEDDEFEEGDEQMQEAIRRSLAQSAGQRESSPDDDEEVIVIEDDEENEKQEEEEEDLEEIPFSPAAESDPGGRRSVSAASAGALPPLERAAAAAAAACGTAEGPGLSARHGTAAVGSAAAGAKQTAGFFQQAPHSPSREANGDGGASAQSTQVQGTTGGAFAPAAERSAGASGAQQAAASAAASGAAASPAEPPSRAEQTGKRAGAAKAGAAGAAAAAGSGPVGPRPYVITADTNLLPEGPAWGPEWEGAASKAAAAAGGSAAAAGGQQQQQQQPPRGQQPQPSSAPGGASQEDAWLRRQAEEMERAERLVAQQAALDDEAEGLRAAHKKQSRNVEMVTPEMYAEVQELLTMFGIPFIVAPAEAEAQCAFLDAAGLVDGVVTDDSDVFLFDGRRVYRNIFQERRFVEEYRATAIQEKLGLDRERMVELALLLGSDYTEGVRGVGVVNALEICTAFPGIEGLKRFKEWVMAPDATVLAAAREFTQAVRGPATAVASAAAATASASGASPAQPSAAAAAAAAGAGAEEEEMSPAELDFRRRHQGVRRGWELSEGFPSQLVVQAYIQPQVDRSKESFEWGKPDLDLLRQMCWDKFGWTQMDTAKVMDPVMREWERHDAQTRIDSFFEAQANEGRESFAKVKSKRLRNAIASMTGKAMDAEDEFGSTKTAGGNGKRRKMTKKK